MSASLIFILNTWELEDFCYGCFFVASLFKWREKNYHKQRKKINAINIKVIGLNIKWQKGKSKLDLEYRITKEFFKQ